MVMDAVMASNAAVSLLTTISPSMVVEKSVPGMKPVALTFKPSTFASVEWDGCTGSS